MNFTFDNDYRIWTKRCPTNHEFINNQCVRCSKGHLSFEGWISCIPWLNCGQIGHDVRVKKKLSKLGHLNSMKKVFVADWQGHEVVYSKCLHEDLADDCRHGIDMLQGLQPSDLVVQLIGVCLENFEVNIINFSILCLKLNIHFIQFFDMFLLIIIIINLLDFELAYPRYTETLNSSASQC